VLEIRAGRFVELSVTDDGVGMSEDVAAHVFDPFFTTKEPGKGTGLGLSTVYGIVKRAGGAVTVTTSPGLGSRFSVLFPSVGPRPSSEAPERRISERPPGGTETILLVEDEPALRAVVGNILRSAGYEVLETSDTQEAVRIGTEHPKPIDMLLTDVVMPGITGPQLALRLLGNRPSLKVLYMSGHTAEDVGTGLLRKPFPPEVLLARVRTVLDDDA
jgi:two-component system cell cycle sensor histidine kinase/response regulator CckA